MNQPAPLETTVASEDELRAFAERLARLIAPPLQIGLIGTLGAGKTAFVRFLSGAFGVREPVSSPTYVLEHEYTAPNLRIEHWDLYRLSFLPEQLEEPPAQDTIRLIEWPNKVTGLEAELDLIFELTVVGDLEDTAPSTVRRVALTGGRSMQLAAGAFGR